MILHYLVNTAIYASIDHEVLLATTEYTSGSTVLCVQVISRELNEKIKLKLHNDAYAKTSDQVRYFISKTYDSKYREIEKSTFFNRFENFKKYEFATVQEICERYRYTDRNNKAASATVTVVRGKNATATATIEFGSESELKSFSPPEWLTLAN